MKSLFIFLIIATTANNIQAQSACEGIEFPYLFKGTTTFKCTAFPNDVAGGTPYHIASGTDIPFCVDASVSTNSSTGCVDPSALASCIQSDFNEWLSLCPDLDIVASDVTPPEGSCSGATFTIYGSTSTDIFAPGGDGEGAYAATSRITSSNGSILVNQCSTNLDYTGEAEIDHGQTLTTCPEPDGCTDNGNQEINACYVMLHEIGHLFGLLDLDDYTCPDKCGNNADATMYGATLDGSVGDCYNPGLNYCDECYFKDLYCNTMTNGVKSGPVQSMATLSLGPCYPSPFTSKAQVALTVSLPTYIHASLYDVLGHFVANVYNGLEQSGSNTLEVNGSKLAPGTYFLRVNTNSSVATLRIARGDN